MSDFPIAVDLDGTLILTDSLHESALRAVRSDPLSAFKMPVWLAQGRASLKRQLAALSSFDPTTLPYNRPLLDWLQAQRDQGRRLVLCTAADLTVAQAIAKHLGMFDEVMASDGSTNLSARRKAAALEAKFGNRGFDYVGNSEDDLHVWRAARRAVVVNAPERLVNAAASICAVEAVIPAQRNSLAALPRALRLHQWIKNLLLFVAPLAAHKVPDSSHVGSMLLAFASFCLCASAVYVLNDLFDLDNDRAHARKRNRPFASGDARVVDGVVIAPLLLIVAFLLAISVGANFALWLLLYFLVTTAYTFGLKRLILIDCVVLAVLYTLRIIAGAAAASLPLSFWLLAFAVFLFLSLAFVKRYAELAAQSDERIVQAPGRAYMTSDAPLVKSLGITAGYAAVVVLALYLNSDAVIKLYASPNILWCAVLVMLFWVSWIWMKAHRGLMHDDPVLFALRDRVSLASGVAIAVIVFFASRHYLW